MSARTKIVCTMGPSVNSLEKILDLIDAGMNVARLNFSHGTHDEHREVIKLLKKARQIKDVPLAILLDTKGPEVRLGKIRDGKFEVKKGQDIRLVAHEIEGTEDAVQLYPASIMKDIEVGTLLLIDDGYLISKVTKKEDAYLEVEFLNEGILKSGKGVNVPNTSINLPALTERDVADIKFGCENDIDVIAASFVRSAEHVQSIKKLLFELGRPEIQVLAKIENQQGVEHFNTIVEVADGIMVARGDLGVELPLKSVPRLQKMMISRCFEVGKPVITATQMLESMIANPRPTRAEVSDVANAIYDGTSCVCLSGETAVGKYPIEAVQMMKSIIEETEKEVPQRHLLQSKKKEFVDIPSCVALSAVKTADLSDAKAIFVFTSSGNTARVVSKYCPSVPIIALTDCEKTYHQLSMHFGVMPVEPRKVRTFHEAFTEVSHFSLKKHIVQFGDVVVIIAGSNFAISTASNMMMVESIGEVLVKGVSMDDVGFVSGKVRLILPENKKHNIQEGFIAVLSSCDDSYLDALKGAKAIILQNFSEDLETENAAKLIARTLCIPIVVQAASASTCLDDNMEVTLDSKHGVVYKGKMNE